ncbi:MAG: hypothetical protein ACK4TO_04390, partial [Candidatus Nitrosotenuis sp.]
MKTITDADYSNSVKKDTLLVLKRLYHYAVHDEIADTEKGKPYDPLVTSISATISATIKNKNATAVNPNLFVLIFEYAMIVTTVRNMAATIPPI